MCYNCGCGEPDNDHGKGHAGVDPNGKAITARTFQAAAQAFGTSIQDAWENTDEILDEQIMNED